MAGNLANKAAIKQEQELWKLRVADRIPPETFGGGEAHLEAASPRSTSLLSALSPLLNKTLRNVRHAISWPIGLAACLMGLRMTSPDMTMSSPSTSSGRDQISCRSCLRKIDSIRPAMNDSAVIWLAESSSKQLLQKLPCLAKLLFCFILANSAYSSSMCQTTKTTRRERR